jgi:polysaccharide export outer membrane protein
MNKTLINILFLLAVTLMASSCVQHKQLINFNQANLPEDTPEQIVNAMNLTIQPEDALRIEVSSIDEAAAAPFNLGA